VRLGHPAGPHLVQDYTDACLGRLPGCFGASEAGTHDMKDLFCWHVTHVKGKHSGSQSEPARSNRAQNTFAEGSPYPVPYDYSSPPEKAHFAKQGVLFQFDLIITDALYWKVKMQVRVNMLMLCVLFNLYTL
jgi:hypothetical protein